jgi:hypothetical protein
VIDGFTKRYALKRLVHYEFYDDIRSAIQREKNLKHWPRLWKLALIQESNPEWADLYEALNSQDGYGRQKYALALGRTFVGREGAGCTGQARADEWMTQPLPRHHCRSALPCHTMWQRRAKGLFRVRLRRLSRPIVRSGTRGGSRGLGVVAHAKSRPYRSRPEGEDGMRHALPRLHQSYAGRIHAGRKRTASYGRDGSAPS